jgi:sodium/hydrogen exchanger 8
MNDVTAVVLLRAAEGMRTGNVAGVWSLFQNFVFSFLASSAAGIAGGLLSAIVTKRKPPSPVLAHVRYGTVVALGESIMQTRAAICKTTLIHAIHMHADLFSHAHHHTDREVLLITVLPAVVYAASASLNLSGILAVFFCGITISHYTWHSISTSARVLSVHNFRIVASTAETLLFVYAGADSAARAAAWLPAARRHFATVARLAVAALLLLLLLRAAFVAVAVVVVNLWRSYKLSPREAFLMWYGGFARGTMSTALAYSYFYSPPGSKNLLRDSVDDDEIVAAAVAIVLLSTAVFGGCAGRVMAAAELPSVQSRLVDINTLPSFVGEDAFSMNSAAVCVTE